DLKTGEKLWEASEPRGNDWFTDLRLKGTGQEPGFFEAFCYGDLVVVHGLFDVLAFGIKDGKLRWRYLVPFDFEIKDVVMSGDLLVLGGKAETMALYIPTTSPAGEVAWQEKEAGDIYHAPYFHGDRLVSVRKLPFNVTVRYRATGKLIGRLELPDLSLHETHPLVEGGPEELPIAHYGKRLLLSDTWYYIAVDVEKIAVEWKRLIDENDVTRTPAMRFALNEKYFCVLKENYDQEVSYMLSAETGEVLWQTDPKDAKSPQPMHSVVCDGEKVYGLCVHPGQGFFVVGRECQSGKLLFSQKEEGYHGKPAVSLMPHVYGKQLVALVGDRQDFELKVFDAANGKRVHLIQLKGVGPFGVHGRMSATVQGGRTIMMNKEELKL
ncbi:MAG: PQQ-like beta-propeller repeat protein, partial [Planctomycetes bacterium]|nr:PQQ-like beta-propeller repeat protein [Planctomycetota bacterium]